MFFVVCPPVYPKNHYPLKTIQKFIALIVCLFTLTCVDAQQEANWFLGVWKGGSATAKKANKENIRISFEIVKVEGNNFEGLVKVMLLSDTSVHSDSKVTGTITRNYMTAKIGENSQPPKTRSAGRDQFVPIA